MRWWPHDNINLWQIRTQKWHNLSTLSIKYFHSHVLLKMKMTTKFLIIVKLYLFTYKLTNFLKNRVNLPKKFKQRGSAYSQKLYIFQQLLTCFMRGALSWMTFEWTLTQVNFFVKLRSWLIARLFQFFFLKAFTHYRIS